MPGTGTVSPNHTQDFRASLLGGAHALAGHDSHESSARPSPGVAAEGGHVDLTQQMDDQSHPSGNPFMDTFNTPGVQTLSAEEQRRLVQQWKAQGRKDCSTCGAKHPPPCNPGIVKKKKISKVRTPWCRNCQEHHLFGQHTRNKQEMATLLTQQAYGMAPIPMQTMSPGEPDAATEHISDAEIRTTLIHQFPQLLGHFSYQEQLSLRAEWFPNHMPSALSGQEHVFMQYLQESIESHRGEENEDTVTD
jgi:hypothetical protein